MPWYTLHKTDPVVRHQISKFVYIHTPLTCTLSFQDTASDNIRFKCITFMEIFKQTAVFMLQLKF